MANDHIADDRKKVRLIDANRLLHDPYFQEDRYPCSHLIRMAVEEQRTVSAVEVVRCKDCKKCHSWEAPNGATGYECDYHGEDVKLDDFCSYGERRTDG